MASIQQLDMVVTADDTALRNVIQMIRPQWKTDDIRIQHISGSIINVLFKAENVRHPDDLITVKIYGAGSEAIFDRKREKKMMVGLHDAGIIPPLYCQYTNGFACKYVPGETLKAQHLLDPKVYGLVIEKMHTIHRFEPERDKSVPVVDAFENHVKLLTRIWEHGILEVVEDLPGYKDNFPAVKKLYQEMSEVINIYAELKQEFPYCFCHWDMHRMNLIYNEDKEELSVLDWELADYVSEIADIGCYFIRDTTAAVIDAGIEVPNCNDELRKFLVQYLETHPKITDKITSSLVDKWMIGLYKAMYIMAMISLQFLLSQSVRGKSGVDFMRLAINHYGSAQLCLKNLKEMTESSQN